MLFQLKKKKDKVAVKNKRKKKIKGNNFREILSIYIDLLRSKKFKINKLDISLNELGEIDVKIIGEEK